MLTSNGVSKNMRKQNTDGMVRIAQEIYDIIRQYCAQKRLNIRDVANESMKEWASKHISKEDFKLVNEIINRN